MAQGEPPFEIVKCVMFLVLENLILLDERHFTITCQYQIQDFPDWGGGGANPKGGHTNLLFWSNCPENFWKFVLEITKFGPRYGACVSGDHPTPRFANA